jgi:hypothetical protein
MRGTFTVCVGVYPTRLVVYHHFSVYEGQCLALCLEGGL